MNSYGGFSEYQIRLPNWDIGLAPMKWRIAEKKLQQVRKTMAKHISNTNKQVLYAEVECKIKGLVYECTQFCRELRIPNLMIIERTKNEIKEVIKAQTSCPYYNVKLS